MWSFLRIPRAFTFLHSADHSRRNYDIRTAKKRGYVILDTRDEPAVSLRPNRRVSNGDRHGEVVQLAEGLWIHPA
jgi:hypothetical protein